MSVLRSSLASLAAESQSQSRMQTYRHTVDSIVALVSTKDITQEQLETVHSNLRPWSSPPEEVVRSTGVAAKTCEQELAQSL